MPSRREMLATGVLVAVAGCAASSEDDADTGVVLEEEGFGAHQEEVVDLVEGQMITATISGLEEGDRVLFAVGDGTGFAHREYIYEDGTDEYTVESDGQHTVQASADRHEVPMNEDVSVDVTIEISEP